MFDVQRENCNSNDNIVNEDKMDYEQLMFNNTLLSAHVLESICNFVLAKDEGAMTWLPKGNFLFVKN